MFLFRNIIFTASLFFYTVGYAVMPQKKPLNILFVVGYFPSPSQVFILNIITGLIDRGHNVSIFSFNKNSYVDAHPNINKYHLMDRVTYEKFPTNLSECDIVFCQFGYLGQKIVTMKHLKHWLKKKKIAVCFRGADITERVKENPTLYKKMFKKIDVVLPVCDYFKKLLVAAGCNPGKIVVHHSAVDCSKFSFAPRIYPQEGTLHLIAVCRLVKKKGIDYAIKAVAQVIQKHPNIHFTIVGDGPERSALELLIKELKMQDKITLHGWAKHEEVIALLARSHIFLLPSVTTSSGDQEGIPNALKEAMAMGLISIGTWHAGTPELIENGVSGFLVPEKNVIKLAHAIEHSITHPEQWEAMGIAARKKIEDEFEITKVIRQLEELFYTLLAAA